MKYGFTLIEVLVAMTISLGIFSLLIVALNQMNRSAALIDNQIDMNTKAIISFTRFEKDLSGAFIPFRAQKTEDEAKRVPNVAAGENQPAEQPKEKQKPLTHVFYGVNKDEKLDTLTFITNNPLEIYWAGSAGKAKPLIARVIYTLKPEKVTDKRKQSFTLFRKETATLDYQAEQSEQSSSSADKTYELIDGIKSLSMKYVARIEKKEETKTKDKKETKTTYEYKTFDDWNQEKKEKNEKKEGEAKLRIVPHAVEITLELWNNERKRDKKFVVTVPIITELEFVPEIKAQQQAQVQAAQKPGAQPAQPSAQPAARPGAQPAIAQPPARRTANSRRVPVAVPDQKLIEQEQLLAQFEITITPSGVPS